MDGLQANAAQLAARNIKSVKPRRKPIQSNPNTPQSMTFGGNAAGTGGGGLFGGAVQASGSFNFSAPSGGLSFPPVSFGGNNAFGSASDDGSDPRADTTGEEEARRKKPFEGAPVKPPTAQPSLFSQNQQNHTFNSMNNSAQQPNNPFNFQSNSRSGSPGIGGFTSAPTPPASSIFAFGGPSSQPASPAPGLSFGSGQPQGTTASGLFGFGQAQAPSAQPANSIFNFGSSNAAPQNKQANTPFQFSQPSTQPSSSGVFGSTPATQAPASNLFGSSQPSSSGMSFGSTPATAKPATNIFGTPQPSSSGISFGSTPVTAEPVTNIFGTTQPSSSGMSFGAKTATAEPTTNIFGTSQPPQPTPSNTLFGSVSHQPTPSTGIFANLNSPASLSSGLFNSQQGVKPAVAPSTSFGGQSQSPSISNVFNKPSQAPSESNLFGKQTSVTPSTGSVLSSVNKPSELNLFGSPKSAPANNLFGGTPTASTNDLFGNLNKPVDQPTPQSKANDTPTKDTGSDAKTGESSTASLFSKATPNIFGGSSSLSSAPIPPAEISNTESKPAFLRESSQPSAPTAQTTGKSGPSFSLGSSQSSAPIAQTNSKSPVSPMKSIDAPSSANQPPPNGMFPNLPPTPIKSSDVPKNTNASMALTTTTKPPSSSNVVNGNSTKNANHESLYDEMAAASAITEEQMSSMVPARFSESQKTEFYTAYRLRSLNKAVENFIGSVTLGTDIGNIITYYNEKKVEILDRSSFPIPGSKRKSMDNENQGNDNPHKRSRQVAPQNSSLFQSQSAATVFKPKAADTENQENENPNKQSRQVATQNSNLSQPQSAASVFKPKASSIEDQENESPSNQFQQDAASNTNIFQLQPQTQSAGNPDKARSESQRQPNINGSSIQGGPHFTPPTTSPAASTPASPSTKGKRKAEKQLTKDDHEREEQGGRQISRPRSNGDSTGSTTFNIFKSIVETPTKASPTKKTTPFPAPPPAKDDAPRFNPFEALPVPKSPTKTTTSTHPTNIFSPKPISNAASNIFGSKVSSDAPNMFTPKLTSTISMPSTSNSTEPNPIALQIPKFGSGSGVNFAAQFAAQAKRSEEETERKLMDEAMEEDMDSDEDEEEWKATWLEKRKSEKEAKRKMLEDISKNGQRFVMDSQGKESHSTNSSTSRNGSESPAKPGNTQPVTAKVPASLFGQPTRSTGSSLFGSGTSTPGLFGSNTGSVLNSHTSGQPAIMTGIFAHLSDADSGTDSAEADDDSGEEASAEEDPGNRDPNYVAADDSGSGPDTPAEETGTGIVSANQISTNVSAFAPSTMGGKFGAGSISGTSSPGGSLFDRITKDSSGNPVRQIPTEDNGNSQPSPPAYNPFASLSKTAAAPVDQTWNPDTPIRFESKTPTPSDSVNPTVSFTEATPTKAPTSNIFGNLNNLDSTPRFSPGLFGSSNLAPMSSIPTSGGVGFGFGASSATSSLFPSAAASTTTSRATSPGNTTDGDGDSEGPDGEKHEQLDLTGDNPGEEDEELLHELRAKALKFTPAEGNSASSWKSQGVGPLRLLKNKETGAARVVLRGEPLSKIILNKALLSNVKYSADKKTIKLLTAAEGGKGLETWLLQVKTSEMAEALAEIMELNKPSE